VAVAKMRNVVEQQIRRNVRNVHLFYQARAALDLAEYDHNTSVLCRSLRRDDKVFSSFGHLVGCMLVEGMFTKGTHAVSYMQLRMQRSRIENALNEAVGFLLYLDRPIHKDRIGQPGHDTLYEYKGKPLILVSGDEAKVALLKQGTGLKRGTRIELRGGGQRGGSDGSASSEDDREREPEPAVIVDAGPQQIHNVLVSPSPREDVRPRRRRRVGDEG